MGALWKIDQKTLDVIRDDTIYFCSIILQDFDNLMVRQEKM